MNDNEARARVLIDTQLADLGWDIHDSNAVRYEVALPDRDGFADYVLCDRHGRALAAIEAWRLQQSGLDAEAERWLTLLGNQIRANADTLDEILPEHFACFHVFENMGGLHEARRVFGGAAPLEALLDSLNGALFADNAALPTADDASAPPPT